MGDRILVVDDRPGIVRLASTVLEMASYDVETTVGAPEALRLVPLVNPSVIVLDVRSPDLGDYEACRALRADPRTSSCPILVLSVESQGLGRRRAMAAGADDFLSKPFDNDELVARVQGLLARAPHAWA